MTTNVIPLHQPATFDDWWDIMPVELRQKRPVCESKWNDITGDGLETRTLDKDSGTYVSLFLKATPEEIIEGTRVWKKRLRMNPDFSYHESIQYEPRAPQFLNQGRWMDT